MLPTDYGVSASACLALSIDQDLKRENLSEKQEKNAMEIWLITLGPLFAIFGISVAQAQDTIDVGKITCEQFVT